jgi:ELWxxDGT repeat protein
MNRVQTFLVVILALMLVPLSGCVTDGAEGPEGPEGPLGPQGMHGENGTNGSDGVDGRPGTNGTDGENGQPGADGISTQVSTFIEYPGEVCEAGGLRIEIGKDMDDNGFLTANEVDEVAYVCDGVDGADASQPASSSTTTLHAVERLGKSDGCPAGGRMMMHGLDNGDNGGTAANGMLELGEVDDYTTYCSTQRVALVDDALPGIFGINPTSYQGMKLVVDDTLYFSADDGIHGEELWAYNLTTDELWMVADIREGENGSYPGYWLGIQHGSQIFFGAYTDETGHELWGHDHSTGTTWLVANLVADQQQVGGSNPGDDIEIMLGNTLYFSAFTLEYATELWAYNTINQSTWLVHDIHMGSSANPGWYMNFIYDDVLYFTARDMGNVHDLWAHNPANSTTWKVAVFGYEPHTHPGNFMEHLIGDTLYFDAHGPLGRELMAYNLTSDTSWVVADLAVGGSSDPGRHMSVVVDDTLLFDTADGSLWAHSTTNHSTWRVMQHSGTNPGEGTKESVIGSTAFFQAHSPAAGPELWAYNANNATAWQVANIVEGTEGSTPGQNMMLGLNGILYFDASKHETGRELWAHDPTDGSVWVVIDIYKDSPEFTTPDPNSNPGLRFWAVHGGQLFFDANDAQHGRELWKMWFEHTVSYGP